MTTHPLDAPAHGARAPERALHGPFAATGARVPVPDPCVLVIGDYREPESFASRAWEKVCEAYHDQPAEVSFGPPPRPEKGLSLAPEALPPRRQVSRAACPNLYPIPLSDAGHARREDVRALLYRYLSSFDVTAIIACGTAANTSGLLAHLGAVQVPVLVTVDSTVEKMRPGGGIIPRPPNVLRLMPNNEQQAQTIVAGVTALAGRGAGARAEVFCHPDDDEYVCDLRLALEEQTRAGPGRPELRFLSDIRDVTADPGAGIVICAGYEAAFAKLRQAGRTGRWLILSDGCYQERVRRLVAQSPDATGYYWARPAFDAAEYAYDAYRSLNAVWQHLIREGRAWRDRPRDALRPFVWLLRQHLQTRRSSHYRFRGLENQRGGYLLEPVSPAASPAGSS